MTDIQDSQYHPFNSIKVLYHKEYIEGIVNKKLLPPITLDFDPSNLCNSNCIWCNSKEFRKKNPYNMDKDHMLKLAKFFGEWGIKSACVAGGGEPTMNPGLSDFLYSMTENNVKTSLITNGIDISKEQMFSIVDNCSWCGFSIDAGNRESFKDVHQVDKFDQVIDNLKELIKIKKERNSKTDITYKFLIHPYNCHTIYNATKIAKAINCNKVQCRPVCHDNLYNQDNEKVVFDVDKVNSQLEKAFALTDDSFKFFGIKHKFGANLERVVRFKKCRAVSIMAIYCADGTVQLCHDLRGKEDWILCRHDDPYEILNVWGFKEHLDIIDNIDPNNCPRCTFQPYNELIENLFVEDNMFRDFP